MQHGDVLAGKDVIVFVDNDAACAVLIRGSTSQEDACDIAQALHWRLTAVGCRAWFEWVDSESNPSDGLSRDGEADEWTLKQC